MRAERNNMAQGKKSPATLLRSGKEQTAAESGKIKLSLYPLTIEEAIKAALQTGRTPPMKPKLANRQRKKRTKPA
jgi:hypothetical protein